MVKITRAELAACEAAACLEKAEDDYALCLLEIERENTMHVIEDKRLEECRKFLVLPGPPKSREELLEIVRDLTWAVEELQLRRLAERTPIEQKEDNRPYLLFGSDDSMIQFVGEHELKDDQWHEATEKLLVNILPRSVRARKLDGADEALWKQWEELCRTYDAKPEGNA